MTTQTPDASPTDLRRALDALGYQFVFNAIADAVDWKPHRTFGISVERLISGLTGVGRSSDPALSPTRSPETCACGPECMDLGAQGGCRHTTRSPVVEPGSAAADNKREGWRPISEAPTTGVRIVATNPLWPEDRRVRVVWWVREGPGRDEGEYWQDDADSEPDPTLWQPLGSFISPAPAPSGDVAGLHPDTVATLESLAEDFELGARMPIKITRGDTGKPLHDMGAIAADFRRILSALSPASGGKA